MSALSIQKHPAPLAIILGLLCCTSTFGATITALSCSQLDVQAALSLATNGDTVTIPAGVCSWTSSIHWTAPSDVIVKGAGDTSVLGGGDHTIIVDNADRSTLGDI